MSNVYPATDAGHVWEPKVPPQGLLPLVQETRDSDKIRNGAWQCDASSMRIAKLESQRTSRQRRLPRDGKLESPEQNSERRLGPAGKNRGVGAADLVPGEVDDEAGLGLQVLAAGEADAVPEQLQRRVDEGQEPDGHDVPDKDSFVIRTARLRHRGRRQGN